MTAASPVAPSRDKRRHFLLALGIIAAIGLAVRVWYISHLLDQTLLGDGFAYYRQAAALLDGKGFVNQLNGKNDAIHPPLWAIVLAATRALGSTTWGTQQYVAACIGTVTVGLVGFVGRKLAGPRTGLIAAAIAALYPGLWRYERDLLSETLLLPLIALTLLLVYRFHERPGLGRAVGLGAMVALLASTRAEQILIAPLVVVPVVLAARRPDGGERPPLRDRLTWLVAAGALAVVMLAPWTIYNIGRFDQQPVLLSNGFSGASGVANCDKAYYGPKTGYYELGCFIGDPDGTKKSAYLKSHLGRLPLVVFAREGRAWGYWAPFQQAELDAAWDRAPLGLHWASLFGYWLLVIPSIAGGVVLRRRRVPIYPLLGFVVTVIVAVALTFGEPRYRTPAEIPIVVLAAVAIDALMRRVSGTNDEPEPRPADPESDLVTAP